MVSQKARVNHKDAMPRFIFWTTTGAILCGASWWAKYLQAQGDATVDSGPVSSVWDLVQLGGTGGLVFCLITAVVTLWKERQVFLKLLKEEREAHRNDVKELSEQHKKQVSEITNTLLSEMRSQIQSLREESAAIYETKKRTGT